MRTFPRLVIGASIVTAGLAAAVVGPGFPARAAVAVNYVALGDSYSSGVGAGDTSGTCGQSPNAYPELWAKASAVTSFRFAACSGATTSDVLSGQLSALSSSTTLVSLTIGGNDVGFSSVMETCFFGSAGSCQGAVAAGEKTAQTTLPGRLDAVLAGIHAHAPDAKVVVLGYPDFYDTSASSCPGLSGVDHQALDAGINQLDRVLQAAAARGGAAFADVRSRFSGHELCDNAGWLNSITWPIGNSYHPTATGQQDGYLPAFTAAAAAGQ